MEYLLESSSSETFSENEKKTLTTSVRTRIGSLEFKSMLVSRARLFLTTIGPMRVKSSSKESGGMRGVPFMMDELESGIHDVIDNPSIMSVQGYTAFDEERYFYFIRYTYSF